MITSPATIEERFTGLLQHVMVCLSGPRRGCLTLPTLVQTPPLRCRPLAVAGLKHLLSAGCRMKGEAFPQGIPKQSLTLSMPILNEYSRGPTGVSNGRDCSTGSAGSAGAAAWSRLASLA